MFVFHSMIEVTVAVVITACVLTTLALRKQPFQAAALFVQEIFISRKFMLHFLAMAMVLFFNKIEIVLENHMEQTHDFTPSIYKFEGDFVAAIQRFFEAEWLTYALSYFYIVVFPALMITSILVYTARKQYTLYYAICYAFMLNYMIAIPFYFFFPVNEVHAFHPNVDLLILQAFPAFETEYRPLSDLDNCVPSLHTSISVSVALIAMRSGSGFWRIFAPVSAAVIIFSIFYLGIHWMTDMVAGLLLGIFAAHRALRMANAEERLPIGGQLLPAKKRNIQKW